MTASVYGFIKLENNVEFILEGETYRDMKGNSHPILTLAGKLDDGHMIVDIGGSMIGDEANIHGEMQGYDFTFDTVDQANDHLCIFLYGELQK